MIVTYLFRHPRFFSIERVFDTIAEQLSIRGISIKKIYMPYYLITPISIIRNIIYSKKHSNGIVHITGDVHYAILGLDRNKTILTIHDIGSIIAENNIKKTILDFFWLYIPLKLAKYITCISEFTKNEICKKYPWAKDRIRVVPDPLDSSYMPHEKSFNSEKPVVLHIGVKPNKNLERVIEALSGVKCTLRIIGKINDDIKNLLDFHHIDFSNVYDLTDQAVLNEYQNCDVVSFPSLYEGFGMPIIEGQAVGRIVVTSLIDPLTEVGADGVIYVNPKEVPSIRMGFELAINNAEVREETIKKGFVNVNRFSAEKIANTYLAIYDEIENNTKK